MRDRLRSDKCARKLKALAAPERLKIVQCLQDGPRSVTELADALGRSLANVSHHLGILKNAGLVRDERMGKFIRYSLPPDVFQPAAGDDPAYFELGCCSLQMPEVKRAESPR
jgi:DNA-binding transcriptional ArsR family regulator